jgi:hypothetical protein
MLAFGGTVADFTPAVEADGSLQRMVAEQILASPDWKAVSDTKGRSRDRMLGRLMHQALKREGGQSDALRLTGP